MKIHIHCPGPMEEGLDSPCRGEGRWSQNLVRLLASDGHDIVVTAGGRPVWGSCKPIDNVTLIPENSHRSAFESFEPFDINMDSAWWKGKVPTVVARKHLVLKWSIEDYTAREALPENQYLCYPLAKDSEHFFRDSCVNRDRTFLLPLPLGKEFRPPNLKKKGLLWTSKDIEREQRVRDNACTVMTDVLTPLLENNDEYFVVWLMLDLLRISGVPVCPRPNKDTCIPSLVPYKVMRELLSECRLVVAINLPGSVLDAAVLGVPTLEWEEGGFFNHLGRKHGVLIESGASPQRIRQVVSTLLQDEDTYSRYVEDVQNELRQNLDGEARKHFYSIVEKIF